MAVYGSNNLAVRSQRNEIPEGQTEKVLTEMPPGTPMVGGLHPGGKAYPCLAVVVPDPRTYRGGRGYRTNVLL
jgi:hypothetical protein